MERRMRISSIRKCRVTWHQKMNDGGLSLSQTLSLPSSLSLALLLSFSLSLLSLPSSSLSPFLPPSLTSSLPPSLPPAHSLSPLSLFHMYFLNDDDEG